MAIKRKFSSRTKNVKNLPFIEAAKIILPLLCIKLGLMKNVIKAINRSGRACQNLRKKFQRLSEAKLKAHKDNICWVTLYSRRVSLQLREQLGSPLNQCVNSLGTAEV